MTQLTGVRAPDKLDRIWASMPAADRIALLGHDRAELTAADKLCLAAVARNAVRSGRR
jgi:hypothetical protein